MPTRVPSTSARAGSALQLHAECHPPEKTPAGTNSPSPPSRSPSIMRACRRLPSCRERVSTSPNAYPARCLPPYRFAKRFDEASGYRRNPCWRSPLKTMPDEAIGALQVINPVDESGGVIPFSKKDEKMMLHFASIAVRRLQRARMTRGIHPADDPDGRTQGPPEDGAHVNRVAAYRWRSNERGRSKRGFPQKTLKAGATCSAWRPCSTTWEGGVSDLILKKPGRLTTGGFEMIKQPSSSAPGLLGPEIGNSTRPQRRSP